MKYLIIGASGFIGSTLYQCCKTHHKEVYGTCLHHTGSTQLKLFDQTSLITEEKHSPFRPACSAASMTSTASTAPFGELLAACGITAFDDLAVILCGANAGIDACKRDEQASRRLNVTSTERMIDEIRRIGAKPVFLSSEAVFDGKQGLYREEDPVCPVCLYGRQKAEVEEYLRTSCGNYLILRISRAVSSRPGRGDIFDEFRHAIRSGQQLVCLRGQSFNPTDVEDIARVILLSCEAGLSGLYHIANTDYVSRKELALRYAGEVLKQEAAVVEKDEKELGFLDHRHTRGGLNAACLERRLNYQYKTLDEIFAALRSETPETSF